MYGRPILGPEAEIRANPGDALARSDGASVEELCGPLKGLGAFKLECGTSH